MAQLNVRLVPVRDTRQPRQPGSARGQLWMSEDFEETPEDFKDYLSDAPERRHEDERRAE
jgi:hypothetical protein